MDDPKYEYPFLTFTLSPPAAQDYALQGHGYDTSLTLNSTFYRQYSSSDGLLGLYYYAMANGTETARFSTVGVTFTIDATYTSPVGETGRNKVPTNSFRVTTGPITVSGIGDVTIGVRSVTNMYPKQ